MNFDFWAWLFPFDFWSWLLTRPHEAVWYYFVNGFCVALVRPLVVAVPLLVVFGGQGRAFGVPQLFRRQRRWDRVWIGAGVGLLVWQVVLAGYLFEEFATSYTKDRPTFCERRPSEAIPPGVTEDAVQYRYYPADASALWGYAVTLAVGAVGCVLAVAAFAGFVRVIIREVNRRRKREPAARQGTRPSTALPHWGWVLLGMVAGFAGMMALAWLLLPGKFVHRADELPCCQQPLHRLGEWWVNLAGYGDADWREAGWEAVKVSPDDTGPKTFRSVVRDKPQDYRKSLELYYPVYGLFFAGFGVAALVAAVLFALRRTSPAAGLNFLLHLLLAAQTVFDYFLPYPHLGSVALVLVVVLVARAYKLSHPNVLRPGAGLVDLERHHRVVAAYYDLRRQFPAPPPTPKRLLRTPHLGRWNEPGVKRPLVIVCASGGGSRAAAWTMRVLTELERRVEAAGGPAFPYHVRLVCGASGGMIAAAHYVATLQPPAAGGGLSPARTDPFRDGLNAAMRGDFLTPVVDALTTGDLFGVFHPRFVFDCDRGKVMERAWRRPTTGRWAGDTHTGLAGSLDQTFLDLRDGELAGWRPSLVFSPMMVEDGRQLLISNLDLLDVVHNRGVTPAGDELRSREGVEFFRLFRRADRFTVATAARMSATFPYILPAVPLPTDPRRRVVDAGYYDNYGVGLAASWVFTHLDWIAAHVSKLAVVQIRDGLSADDRLMTRPTDATPGVFGLAAEFLTSPPVGLYQARVASNAFRNDNLLHLLHQRVSSDPRFGPGFFVSPAFEFPAGADVSLSFSLTEAEADQIAVNLPSHPPPAPPAGTPDPIPAAVRDLDRRVNAFVNWYL